ncbi:response regulator [Halovenus halobia]|uniref:response regulator n=1 Tax=Halovenus halobia TaxID=3396622 RepID=UPI003F57A065
MTTAQDATVLIVDDEQPLLDSYAAMLGMHYDVDTAASGDAALEAVDHETDVVLLDRRLPEWEGTEILTTIRERGLDCQVLFCSAVVPDVDILSVEPDDYLHKPVGIDELTNAIEAQLEMADKAEAVREYERLERLKEILQETQSQARLSAADGYQQLLDQLEQRARTVGQRRDNAPTA